MFLGIDLGTSSLKAVLADGEGRILDRERAGYPVFYPREGWSEQQPEDWYRGLVGVLQALGTRRDLSAVEGISFCGQMHGLVLLDGEDRVIRPAILWNDSRTVEEVDLLNREIGRETLIARTGNVALTGFTAPKLLWVRRHEPERFARIARVMLPKDYLAYRISGAFASDVTDSSGTLYFDTEHRRWSAPMLDFLEIPAERLPAVYESWTPVGTVRPEFAALTGLSPAARVIIGGGDQAVGALGAGAVAPNQVSVSLGTSGVVFASSPGFAADPAGRLHSFCHANGGYHMMGVILSAAASLDWWAGQVLGRTDLDALLAEVDLDAEDDLLFLPYLMGERSPINDPAARGIFSGLSLRRSRPAMTRAVLEGVAFALNDCYQYMLAAGIRPAFARVIGGGARSPVWLQILSDVLNLELRTLLTTDGGALGAVMLAMVGCGRFPTPEEASAALVREDGRFLPDPDRSRRCREKFSAYRRLRQLSRAAREG